MALKYLMPALMHFYIGGLTLLLQNHLLTRLRAEVEQTGASSQFYDKFSTSNDLIFVIILNMVHPPSRRSVIQFSLLSNRKSYTSPVEI